MNSELVYKQIIDNAVGRPSIDGEYYETHHIVPRSMGGKDDESNLVRLTGREHYIAHWLLFRIHGNKQMAYAWIAMLMNRDGKRYTSRSFAYARKHSAIITAKKNVEREWTAEMRKKSSDARKGVFVRGTHQRARPVVNIDTGIRYECMTDAADDMGVTKAAIQNSITRRGKCKGATFRHA